MPRTAVMSTALFLPLDEGGNENERREKEGKKQEQHEDTKSRVLEAGGGREVRRSSSQTARLKLRRMRGSRLTLSHSQSFTLETSDECRSLNKRSEKEGSQPVKSWLSIEELGRQHQAASEHRDRHGMKTSHGYDTRQLARPGVFVRGGERALPG